MGTRIALRGSQGTSVQGDLDERFEAPDIDIIIIQVPSKYYFDGCPIRRSFAATDGLAGNAPSAIT